MFWFFCSDNFQTMKVQVYTVKHKYNITLNKIKISVARIRHGFVYNLSVLVFCAAPHYLILKIQAVYGVVGDNTQRRRVSFCHMPTGAEVTLSKHTYIKPFVTCGISICDGIQCHFLSNLFYVLPDIYTLQF